METEFDKEMDSLLREGARRERAAPNERGAESSAVFRTAVDVLSMAFGAPSLGCKQSAKAMKKFRCASIVHHYPRMSV